MPGAPGSEWCPPAPEERKADVFLPLILQWEHQNQCGDVAGAGKIKTSIALTTLERIQINRRIALIKDLLRNEGGRTGYPHVKPELLKHCFFCRVLHCLVVILPDTFDINRLSEAWICLVPVLLIVPVLIIFQSVDDWVKRMIHTLPGKDVLGLLMQLIADRILVCTRRRNNSNYPLEKCCNSRWFLAQQVIF